MHYGDIKKNVPLDASNQRQLNCYFDSLSELIKSKPLAGSFCRESAGGWWVSLTKSQWYRERVSMSSQWATYKKRYTNSNVQRQNWPVQPSSFQLEFNILNALSAGIYLFCWFEMSKNTIGEDIRAVSSSGYKDLHIITSVGIFYFLTEMS